jgi:hypothetical protein
MNLLEMETVLKRYGFETADPLLAWLNAALKEVESTADWPWLEEGPVEIKVGSGSKTIILPTDIGKIMGVKDITNEFKLVYYDRRKFMRLIFDNTEEGLPEVYTLVGLNAIQIWRVLQSETTFEVLYQGVTPKLTKAEDEPTTGTHVWPDTTHYPIVMRAASLALQAENEEERAKTAQSEYDAALLRLVGKYCGERELDEPTTVEDAQGYGHDGMPSRWSQL